MGQDDDGVIEVQTLGHFIHGTFSSIRNGDRISFSESGLKIKDKTVD
jgi:hypothetical protein